MKFAFFTCLDPLREFFHALEKFGFLVAIGFVIMMFLISEDDTRKSVCKIFLFGLIVFFASKFIHSLLPTTENMLTSYKIQLLVQDGKNEQAVELIDKRLQKATGKSNDKQQEDD